MLQATTRTVDAHTAAGWLAAGDAVLIDVREPDEFRSEHIAYAASMPPQSVVEQAQKLGLPETRRVIFQCLSGAGAAQVCATVASVFPGREVYNLDGGIAAWKQAGLPVIRSGAGGKTFPSLFRQVQIAVGALLLIFLALGFAGYMAGFVVATAMAAMLVFAGATGWCGMAMLLARMPWNRA